MTHLILFLNSSFSVDIGSHQQQRLRNEPTKIDSDLYCCLRCNILGSDKLDRFLKLDWFLPEEQYDSCVGTAGTCQQQGVSHESSHSDLCSLSLGIHVSEPVDCNLKLGLPGPDESNNPRTNATSTRQEMFSLGKRYMILVQYNTCLYGLPVRLYLSDVWTCLIIGPIQSVHILAVLDYCNRQGAELHGELQKFGEQQQNSIERHYEEKIIQKNRELEDIYEKYSQLMEEVREKEAEVAHWQFQAWKSQIQVKGMESMLKEPREGCGENDAASYVVDDRQDCMVTRCCVVCKRDEAKILYLSCHHLSVCGECNRSIDACPVCLSPKSQSIEVIYP